MSALNDLTEKALALPEPERIALAQNLWASIEHDELTSWSEEDLRRELKSRLRDEPDASWKSHKEVMEQARSEFGWKKK
ncbi:MAG: hypothetical protein JWO95_1890 [Verrucomicrobiales bacterium]|nr:hypothetical protein [Verrucomicrobiales bacterium]